MKISASIDLIWQLAGAEAISGEFGEIQPEHFCIGLLKFSELSEKDAEKVVGEGEAAKVFVAEVQSLRDALTKSSIDTTRVRRRLRAELGKGGVQHKDGKIHRSAASREMFELAATLAAEVNSDSLTALHLLTAIVKSPAPAIAHALRGVAVSPPQPIETPLLDKLGKDLIKLALQGEFHVEAGRTAECKVILQVLARKKNVFLVAKTEEAAHSTLVAMARFLHTEGKARPIVEQIRLIDTREWPDVYVELSIQASERMYGEMLDEAARCSNVLLVCAPSRICNPPGINAFLPAGMKVPADSSRLAQTKARCIIAINAQDYEALLKADRQWKRLAEPVWVGEEGKKSVPKEL
jgi:hypothetical protein